MSHHAEQFTSQSNVNSFLKRLGSSERLTPNQISLLNEYQTLRGNQNESFLRGCAELAINELNESKYSNGLILTEWGVSPKKTLEGRYYAEASRERSDRDVRNFAISLASANIDFLEKWDEIRKRKQLVSKIDEEIVAMQNFIDANKHLFITVNVIAEMLEGEGFVIQNPEVLEMSNTEIIQRGIKIVGKNSDGVEKEVAFLHDGTISSHVNHPEGLQACKKMSEAFANQISTLVGGLTEQCGVPRIVQTKKSGVGRGQTCTPIKEEGRTNNGPILTRQLTNKLRN